MDTASRVALVACPDYDREHVFRAVRQGLNLLGSGSLPSLAGLGGIMGIGPLAVPFIRIADGAGLGNARAGRIELLGETLEGYSRSDMDARARPLGQNVPRFLIRVAKNLIASKPVIDDTKCSRCGQCVEACPTDPKSLRQEGQTSHGTTWGSSGVPHYLYSTCIRCYCCQETCPTGAISIRRAPLAGVFEGRRESAGRGKNLT